MKPLGLIPITKGKSGRPRKYENDNERKRAYDRRKRESLLLRKDFVQSLAPITTKNIVFLNEQDESTYRSKGDFVRLFRGSYYKHMGDTNPRIITRTENEFINLLKDMYSHVYEQKDDIPAITGALFDPSVGNGGIRDQTTVLLTRGMWLDFEGGDLSVTDFEHSFPHLPFIAYSTFRHTKQEPRFKVYIPTNRSMHEQISIAIYQEIGYSLKNQGWKQG